MAMASTEPRSKLVQARLQALAERAADALGLEMVHVAYKKEGRNWIVRLYVDREGGITLDDCSQASEQLSALLDTDDLIPHAFTLEVSSPGLDRPLFNEKDYRRFAGRRVKLTTFAPIEGRRNFTGVITGCPDRVVGLRLDDGNEVALPLDDIAGGRLEIDLDDTDRVARSQE